MKDLLNKRYFQILAIGGVAILSLILLFAGIMFLQSNQITNTHSNTTTSKVLDDYDTLDEEIDSIDDASINIEDISDYSLGISDNQPSSSVTDTNDIESFLNNVTDISNDTDINY